MLARATYRALQRRTIPPNLGNFPATQNPLSPSNFRCTASFQSRFYAKGPRIRKPLEYKAQSQSRPGNSGSVLQRSAQSEGPAKAGENGPSETSADAHTKHQSKIDPSTRASEVKQGEKQTKPLPDLTQGIPSTLGAEIESAANKRADPGSLNITEVSSAAGGRAGGGDLPRTAYISSFERRRNRWANYFYGFTLFAFTTSAVLLGRNWETEEEERKHPEAPSGWGFRLFYNRAKARLAGTLDYYNEPAFEKLLPNPDPSWERPYTLVLSLEDLLVHSEWDREHGWRMAKRPGADYFLRYLSQYYELVIFTSVPSMIGQPIITKLDPYHIVMWPLFREATRYKNGAHIKVGCQAPQRCHVHKDLEADQLGGTGSFFSQQAPQQDHCNGHRLRPCTESARKCHHHHQMEGQCKGQRLGLVHTIPRIRGIDGI